MNRPTLMFVVLAGAATIAAGASVMTSNGTFENGTYRERTSAQERYDFGFGSNYGLYRQSVLVPAEYGRLVNITQGASGTILWYEADDKTVRNIVVNGDQMVVIRRSGKLVPE